MLLRLSKEAEACETVVTVGCALIAGREPVEQPSEKSDEGRVFVAGWVVLDGRCWCWVVRSG